MPFVIDQCTDNKPNRRTIPNATTTQDGVMSAADKVRLDALVSAQPAIPLTDKSLTNNTVTPILTVALSQVTGRCFAMALNYAFTAIDATDGQVKSGTVEANFAGTSSGSYTSNSTATEVASCTSGTLGVAFSWSISGSTATFRAQAISDLTPTAVHVFYYVAFCTHPNAVAVA